VVTNTPELENQVMNEFQEFVFDQKWQLVETKGKLFGYKRIGGQLTKGHDIDRVLGRFWNKELKTICLNALENGITGTRVSESSRDGKSLALFFVVVPYVRSGRVRGLVLTIHDITVAKRLERQQNLREKMKVISHLASEIVHNMNNPIAAVLNRIGGLLVEDVQTMDPQELNTNLRDIQEQLYNMSLVTNALTAFSTEKVKDFKLINANKVIENTVNLLNLLNQQKEIHYKLQLEKKLPPILGSEVTLEQAVVNVCRNAIESMPRGGSLSITTKVDEQFHDFINISISDDGVGIPAEKLELVFDPFYTTKDDNHTGLGLSVCYGIISNHNGSIEIFSELESGTTIQILLPIAKL